MADTVASIEAAVSNEITQANNLASGLSTQVETLLTDLTNVSKTLFIPASPDLSAIYYTGGTKSGLSLISAPDIPSNIENIPTVDTSVEYFDADSSGQIDPTNLKTQKQNFITSVMSGMINPSSIKISLAYKDPMAPASPNDGGSDVVLLVSDKINSGMAGYLVLTDEWANNSFDANKERDIVALERASVRIQRKWSGRGFNRAPGMVSREIADVYQTQIDTKSKQSRELASKQYDSSFAFRQSMISAALGVAAEAISHANKIQDRAFEAAKSVERFAIDQYNLIVARWQNRIDLQKLNLSVASKNLDLSVRKATYQAEGSADDNLLKQVLYEQETKKYKSAIRSYKDTLRAFSSSLGLTEANDRIKLSNDSITLQQAELNAKVSMANAKLSLKSLSESMASEITAISGGGKMYSNAVASVNRMVATLTTLENAGQLLSSSNT